MKNYNFNVYVNGIRQSHIWDKKDYKIIANMVKTSCQYYPFNSLDSLYLDHTLKKYIVKFAISRKNMAVKIVNLDISSTIKN